MKIHTKPRDWQKRIDKIRNNQRKLFVVSVIYAIALIVGCVYLGVYYGNK